jgi:hypothetical protein
MIQDPSLRAHEVAKMNLGAKQNQVPDALGFFPDATNAELAAHLTRGTFELAGEPDHAKSFRAAEDGVDPGGRTQDVQGHWQDSSCVES